LIGAKRRKDPREELKKEIEMSSARKEKPEEKEWQDYLGLEFGSLFTGFL
jgi:hypothetical protein